MRRSRDTFDALTSAVAVVVDAVTVFASFMLAVWIRFDSGWLAVPKGIPPRLMYIYAAGAVMLIYLVTFKLLGLYIRPQYGHVSDPIPRQVRASGISLIVAAALAFIAKTDPPFSGGVVVIAFFTVTGLIIIERNVLFQMERHWAKYQASKKKIIILGVGETAAHLKYRLEGEPRRRAKIEAFLKTHLEERHEGVPPGLVKGDLTDLPERLSAGDVDEVILANPSDVPSDKTMEIVLACERNLAVFHMVPDTFRVLTSKVDLQTVGDIPLLGVGKLPLDFFWNRMLKRAEDVAGSLVGLICSAPVMAVAAVAIKAQSKGPVFYAQERCGENGRVFTIYKLRTMEVDAEAESGPVWATEDDDRRTGVGSFLRRHNIDELPQFWNVLRGQMSLVGPRPERPHFVEQFKEDINRYMWRHVSKPGITGWAQVNGLRGNTSIHERIKYDLYYLENWSLSLDFKILVRTLFSKENAY